jgi:exopolysaccharide biosynthesis polyprenyl glycosylphosphotransferase
MESAVAAQAEPMQLDVAPDAAALETPTLEIPAVEAPRRTLERSSVLARSLAASDLLMCLVACDVAALATGLAAQQALAFAFAGALVYPLIMFFMGIYAVDDLGSWASGVLDAPKALVGAILFSWPLFAIAWLAGSANPALTAVLGVAATVLASTTSRGGIRAVLHRADPLRQRVVIVGSGVVAGQLAEKLHVHQQFGLTPVGLIDDDFATVGTPNLPRLGGLRDLPDILRRGVADRVMIAFSRASHDELLKCIRTCREDGVAVDIVPRLFEFLDGARAVDTVGGLPILSLGTPRLTRSSRVAKRLLDVVLSLFLLTLLAPLFLLVAVAIKLESRGPALFRQTRVGRGGATFSLLKFRSMYARADEHKDELGLLNDVDDGVMFKIRRDPRVTRVGRWLRRLSLDELPQLINVLKGEMSLVGPRPLIHQESAALDEDWHIRRLDLRPGMTGIWQVQGRSESPFQEMIRLDYQYVAGWSLARDLEILFATIPAVVSGRGAY